MTPIAVIDYGLGNLFNVERALTAVGASSYRTSNPEDLQRASGIVLPGVGAFGQGMQNLERQGLVEPIRQLAAEGRPLLGICLGMQLLMNDSEEFGNWPGLGLVEGKVTRLLPGTTEQAKIPQIGWNSIDPALGAPERWAGTILDHVEPGAYAYFVHSYCVETARPEDSLADTTYAGARFCSVVAHGNVMGCQFHPEKSGEVGLEVLKNWLAFGVRQRDSSP